MSSTTQRTNSRAITLLFLTAAAFAVASFVAGFVSRGPQWQGACLAAALVAAGIALVLWANHLLAGGPYEEARERLSPPADEVAAMEEDLERGEALTRRVWLRRSAVLAGGALVIGLAEPVRTLGPTPGRAPLRTAWRDGVRVVTTDNVLVRADDVPLSALLTVFPQDHLDEADGQVVLVRVDPSSLALPEGRSAWAPGGLVAYSKVCTHAGCPVGLYQADIQQLLCPCHQSSFDVLRGAVPVSGPAAWPLPQLPLRVDDEGVLVAAGDFDVPVGPGWWKA
ncbi:MAG: ubiquinol-cytochrome c reductase iron-sulfur subunit [Ilumatobacteraceae bacterium]